MESARLLQFGCPQCMARLTAPRRRGGGKGRCPRCQYVFVVPRESRLPATGETYALEDEEYRPPDALPEYLRVACRVCGTGLVGTVEQVGEALECPDCGTWTVVARPEKPKAAPAPPTPEAYPIYEGEGQPPADDKTVYGRHVAVNCRECRTRMLATEEQVGRSLICPDCGTATVVPPYRERAPEAPLTTETYALRDEPGQPPPDSAACERQFAYRCPRCQTRMQSRPAEAGEPTKCPDCGEEFRVPPAPPPAARPTWEDEVVEGYAAGRPIEPPPVSVPGYAPVADDRPLRPTRDDDERPPGWCPPLHDRPAVPRHPFVVGVYEFLFYRGVRALWAALAATLAAILFLLLHAARLISIADLPTYFLGMMEIAAATVVGLIGLAAFGAYLLTILRDTSEGADRIENWPDGVFNDWMLHFVPLVTALGGSMAVGVAIDRGAIALGAPEGIGLAAGVFLFFPLLLLSVLETGSPFSPISLVVLRSVGRGWLGWLAFYVQTAALFVGVGAACEGLARWWGGGAIVPAAIVVAGAIVVYFRLLGRLAWYSADRLPG